MLCLQPALVVRRHCLLHVCRSSRHGYNTTLSAEVVFRIEATLGNITNMLEQLAMDMFSVRTSTAGHGTLMWDCMACMCKQTHDHVAWILGGAAAE
jgi:hypothetical protein